jgi:succinate dehydrogenase/fumarate reductase flavoprotein subunit
MGWYAGDMAAGRAVKQKSFVPLNDEQTRPLRELCSRMLSRKVGFHWSELEVAVQKAVDYYCPDERSAPYLERGLARLKELAEDTPLKAENPHELGRCLEVRSIMENAEMVMRASLARKESRLRPARFTRVDYPEQDDARFFCFLRQQRVGDGITFLPIPIV